MKYELDHMTVIIQSCNRVANLLQGVQLVQLPWKKSTVLHVLYHVPMSRKKSLKNFLNV